MTAPKTFDEILDAVEELPVDQREELVDVVRRRLAEQRLKQIVEDVRAGRLEAAEGKLSPATVDQIMNATKP